MVPEPAMPSRGVPSMTADALLQYMAASKIRVDPSEGEEKILLRVRSMLKALVPCGAEGGPSAARASKGGYSFPGWRAGHIGARLDPRGQGSWNASGHDAMRWTDPVHSRRGRLSWFADCSPGVGGIHRGNGIM